MKHYGIDLTEGSTITNITMPSGTLYPANANAGELFFRTDLNTAYVHDGTTWNTMGAEGVPTSVVVDPFTGTGAQLNFTLSKAPTTEDELLVFVDGIRRSLPQVSVTGTTLTFSVAPTNGAVIEVIHLPTSITGKTFNTTTTIATTGQTVFTVTYSVSYLMVFLNGIRLVNTTDFTATNGTSVTLVQAAALNDVLDFVSIGVFAAADHYTKSEIDSSRGRKNLIINGNFDIWQRATSQTINGYGSADRWLMSNSGSTKVASRQSFTLGQTEVPNEPTYFCRTIATSVAGVSNLVLQQYFIESVRTLAGKTATLSFYAKADSNKNVAIEFVQIFGTGGSPSTAITAIGVTTLALTTSWQKFTATVAIPSISGKTLGTNNNDSLGINYWFDAGSTWNARTNSLGQQSGTFDIAQVQLEEGSVATNFENRSIGEELQLCQRYYEKSFALDTVPAQNVGLTGASYFPQPGPASASMAVTGIAFSTPKRAVPAVTLYNTSAANAQVINTTVGLSYTASVPTVISTHSFGISATTPAGSSAGNTSVVQWTADAEL